TRATRRSRSAPRSRRLRRRGGRGSARGAPGAAADPASAGSRPGGARPLEIAGEEMGGGARVLGRLGRRLLREAGRETLVIGLDRNVDLGGEACDEVLGRLRLLAPLPA